MCLLVPWSPKLEAWLCREPQNTRCGDPKIPDLITVSGLVIGDLLIQGKLLLLQGVVSNFSSDHEMAAFGAWLADPGI